MAANNDVSNALQNAAKKRNEKQARRKAETLRAADDYHEMQKALNQRKSLAPLDAATTSANLYYTMKKLEQ